MTAVKQNNLLGILLSVAGYSAWVVGDMFVKLAGETLPIIEILFIGMFVGCLFTAAIAAAKGGLSQMSTILSGETYRRWP